MSIRKSSESFHKTPRIPPLLGLSIGILAVSAASIFIRFAQQQAPSLVIAAARLSLAALVLAPLALFRQRAEISQLTRRQLLLLVVSGLFLGLHFASWITSLEYTSVISSVVLVTTTPLWVALLSPLVLKERLTSLAVAGLLLALAGTVVISLGQGCGFEGGRLTCQGLEGLLRGRALTGNLLALVGAWTAAGYMVAGRKLRQGLSLLSYTFLVYGTAALIPLGMMLANGQRFTGYPAQTYVWLVALALIPQLLGHSSFNWALRYLPAVYVSVSLLGEPVGATLLAFLLLREAPTSMELVGGLIILIGIYLNARGSPQEG